MEKLYKIQNMTCQWKLSKKIKVQHVCVRVCVCVCVCVCSLDLIKRQAPDTFVASMVAMNPHSMDQSSRCHYYLLNHKPPESWVPPNHSGREVVV